MIQQPHDKFAKQFLEELLSPFGEVKTNREVTDETRFVDVLFSPTPTSAVDAETLGLLGRIAVLNTTLLEPFRNQPSQAQFAIVNSQFAIIILGNLYRQMNQLFNYIFVIANCELRIANCSEYWLEILIESELVEKTKFESLLQETREVGKILVASTRKIKDKINNRN
ncbi:hypothetical protein LC653_42560 [Nostoc sp. CHAB 5784]|uniref:hypothetical protein n=1 Tax=Nostoc mirabile TaxID=2907820 RepID=UPI001E48B981|nr:hypothetical protein [Nostoc mirabile]MCC5670299.1 hypothetical protein [Nostoc mirabile CHAB5784]